MNMETSGPITPEGWLELSEQIKAFVLRVYGKDIPFEAQEFRLDVTELEDPHQLMTELNDNRNFNQNFTYTLEATEERAFIQIGRKI